MNCSSTTRQKETNVGGLLADDDRIGIGKPPSVDLDDIVAGCKPSERAMNASRELVVGSAQADSFSDCELEHVGNP